jgi:REP element-mobilizing transposase RayT
MPDTYTNLQYHVVFGTKRRASKISADWIARLHAYLGGTVRGLGGMPIAIGGVEDHVHLLVGLKPTLCLADFVREVKKAATSWVREDIGQTNFSWQTGYGAFTVSHRDVPMLQAYIGNQRVHHQKLTWREEFIEICREAGVEPIFWDAN